MLSKNSFIDLSRPSFFDRASIVRIAPFALYMMFLVLASPLNSWFTAMGLDPRWLYALRISAVLTLLLLFSCFYEELKCSDTMPNLVTLSISIVAGIVVFILWIMPWPQWAVMQVDGAGFNALRSDGSIDPVMAVVRLSGAALIVPVMEELFWRSYLLRWIRQQDFLKVDPAKVGWWAFVLVTVLFGLEHSLWLAGMLAGAVYNLLYMMRRNLWASILAHAVTNGLLGIWVLQTGNWQYW